MMGRIARFSVTFDGDPDGTVDAVLNAGSGKGLTVTAVHMKWQPEDMTGSSDVPHVSITRYTSAASGGTSATVFPHTGGDTSAASVLLGPSSLGSGAVNGPQYWPGVASYTGSVWYLHGDQYAAEFGDSEIYVPASNSLRVRTTKLITATVYFYENLTV